MIKKWSVNDIKNEIRKISLAESDPRMDGFVTWERKKELYEIYWFVENCLRHCSSYTGEEDFLKEHEKQEMIKLLKGENL